MTGADLNRPQKLNLIKQVPKKKKKLNATDRKNINDNFKKLKNKCKLATNEVVEDTMHNCLKDFSFEHPDHSLILNSNGPAWKRKFNDAEIAEIERARDNNLFKKPLPSNLSNMLKRLSGKILNFFKFI